MTSRRCRCRKAAAAGGCGGGGGVDDAMGSTERRIPSVVAARPALADRARTDARCTQISVDFV